MIRNQRRNRKYVEQLRATAPFAECSTSELRLVASLHDADHEAGRHRSRFSREPAVANAS